MKAFFLAAGKGTRLQPLTFQTPKCLIPICGQPLVDYWFNLFTLYGINEILMNTSHLAEKVQDYMKNKSGAIKVNLVYEETLLGSGGTIKKNWDFVKDEELFFIIYADNLTNMNLGKMLQFHDNHVKNFTLAVFRVPNPRECGIVEVDENMTIVSFSEKPENPVSDLAFAGIMISNKRLIEYFPDEEIFDLGHDVLPRTAGNAAGYIIEEYLIDVGTHQKLDQAERDVQGGMLKIPV